ncbi:hypothetical protein ACVWY1_003373 [Pseudomonas sp. TE6288]|uniref:hypothetical protein n=1 Tax=Pseudomonas hunanensis TaxID=1247546 RepID=UPI0024050CBC|nr:hypothetical protein [Pseudomonas hunanensis]MDF9755635.1 hypothetical protein [Pseudomonas hunanensis]
MKTLLSRCLLTATCWLLASPAFAIIDVQPKVVDVQQTATSIEIINQGDRPEYVSINLSRLLNPGAEPSDEQLEPVSQIQELELYVYPFRLTLAPGQSKRIRVKPLKTVAQEQVYRVDIRPVINLLDSKQPDHSGNIVVNLAFSGLIRHRPAAINSELKVQCEAQGARLIATGNSRYWLKGASVAGQAVDAFNIYPQLPLLLKGKAVQVPGQATCPGQ